MHSNTKKNRIVRELLSNALRRSKQSDTGPISHCNVEAARFERVPVGVLFDCFSRFLQSKKHVFEEARFVFLQRIDAVVQPALLQGRLWPPGRPAHQDLGQDRSAEKISALQRSDFGL